jgi:hypothetical protein
MNIDRRTLFDMLGGAAAVGAMSMSERADALENAMFAALAEPTAPAGTQPLAPVIEERRVRAGGGRLFGYGIDPLPPLAPMPQQPTLVDFFSGRFTSQRNHCLQSATRAMKAGEPEDRVLACLLHDVAQELICVDHGWWAAQMMAPYVSEKVQWAIRYHQALRFFADESVGYEYPAFYVKLFGANYVPEPYIREAHAYARKHKWYMEARMITVHDYYAFDPKAEVSIDPFVDIIGRHFRQPKAGLGYDNSPSAHMWRSLIFANHPL